MPQARMLADDPSRIPRHQILIDPSYNIPMPAEVGVLDEVRL
jgi:hypothetical protein